jgi:glycosyltransferase involved in cell wall biosynthesis
VRILICNWKDCAHPAAGGAEIYMQEVARQWAGRGHAVTFFASGVRGKSRDEVDAGVHIVRRGSRLGVYAKAREYCRRQNPPFDVVVEGINTKPFGCPRWPGHPRSVAVAFQVADDIWAHETPWPISVIGRHWLEPRWLRIYRDEPVLTISSSSAASLEAAGLRCVGRVPVGCAIEPRAEKTVKAADPTVVFVGRLTAAKRADHAIAAFAAVRACLPSARMWILGTGPMESRLRATRPPGVEIFGRVDEPTKLDLLARAHVLVSCSVREGWGLVVDEAAAVGTPTIAYDVPGLRDSVPPARGELVPPSPSALAERLLLRLPQLVARPPRAGWHGGATDWTAVANAIEAHLPVAVRDP